MHICCLKITSLKIIEFLDPFVCINNPHCQSSRNIIFLCKYYIVTSGTLVDSFLDVLVLLLAMILSELHVKPRRKYSVSKEIYRKICVRGINILTPFTSLCVILFCFLCLLPFLSQVTYLLNGPYWWCSVMIS